ncbi:MAG: ATP-binding protein, partial [Bacteroidales bacterium]
IRNKRKEERLMRGIASIANSSDSESATLQMALDKFAFYIGWPVGHVCYYDKESGRIQPGDIWYCPDRERFGEFIQKTYESCSSGTKGLPGRVIAQRDSVYLEDVKTCENFRDYEGHVVSCFAVPVFIEEDVGAVLEFFHDRRVPEDRSIVKLAEQVGSEIGSILSRKMAKMALEASEAKFRQLAENIGQVLWLQTREEILYISPAYESIFEETPAKLKNDPANLFRTVHPGDRTRIREALASAFRENRSFHEEYRILFPGDRIKWIKTKILPFSDRVEGSLRFVGLSEDVTENKILSLEIVAAKEEAEKANQAKSEFLANMSHEIRTPMNVVVGFSELLSGQIKDPVQKDFINSIRSSGETLLGIINDILDLSKIEAERMELQPEPVHVRSMIEDITQLFSIRMKERNLEFREEISGDVPEFLEMDDLRMKQVLMNLISNAIKFTPEGFVALHLSVGNRREDRVDLSIRVQDSGIGISKKDQDRIFESFQQQEGQMSKKYGGTGLGLTIASQLIKLMGGTIRLESEIDRGSTFILDLPGVRV